MASQCTDVLTRALEALPYWLVFRVLIEKFPHQDSGGTDGRTDLYPVG